MAGKEFSACMAANEVMCKAPVIPRAFAVEESDETFSFDPIGSTGGREIAAMVSVRLLFDWERSRFDIARIWR